jgi:putative ABC transport system permease protein
MRSFAAIFRRVNLRHARRHKLRAFLTVAGIAAGVALTFSISIINATLLESFRSSIKDLAGAAEIEVAASDPSGLPQEVLERVQGTDGVDKAVPLLRATTRLSGFGGSRRVLVVGATADFASLAPKSGPLSDVRIDFRGDLNGILLAEDLAAALKVSPGDRVAVTTPSGVRPVVVAGTVGGALATTINGGDVGVMLLPAAQELFGKVGRIDSIYVSLDPGVSVATVEKSLETELGGAATVGPPGSRGQGVERVFASLGTLLSMGGTVALFVALFVVFNTMSMALVERRREISMLLAFGATPRAVGAAFLVEACAFGISASLLGLGVGLLLAKVLVVRAVAAYSFLALAQASSLVVTPLAVLIAVAGGILVALAGAFVPARRVLRVAPVESLRPEASYEWGRSASGVRTGRRMFALGLGAVVASAACLGVFFIFPDQRWIVTIGLILGLAGVSGLLPTIVPFAISVIRPVMQKLTGTVGRLAADALAKNPGRSTFTVAALVLTLGLVVAVGSALASYEAQVDRTAGALIGADLYVTSTLYTGVTSDQPLDAKAIGSLRDVPGVRYVYPLRFALLDLQDQQALLLAVPVSRAIDEGASTQLTAITDDPQGFLDGLRRGEVVISRYTSETRGLSKGDVLKLPTPQGERSFPVAGIYDDLLSFDSFYMSYSKYRSIWRDAKADEFGILLDDGASIAGVRPRLEAAVKDLGLPARVLTSDEVLGRILDTVRGTFSLANGIQLAALIVAALTIANTMFTAVYERRWEMGLQRAVGMGGKQLRGSVLLEAAGIGAIGGAGGAILGVVSGFFMTKAMEAQFSWRVPYQAPWLLLGLSVLLGIAVAAASGIVPSRLAVRSSIIESLRYE